MVKSYWQRVFDVSARVFCQIQVVGQVLCRLGVLMLTKGSVRVLGGEVDTLVEENTPEAVLSGAL